MVISLIKPEAALRGALSRYFVEIPVHTFAGKIDRFHADILLEKVRATKGKASIITAKNNDSGFDQRNRGKPRRSGRGWIALAD